MYTEQGWWLGGRSRTDACAVRSTRLTTCYGICRATYVLDGLELSVDALTELALRDTITAGTRRPARVGHRHEEDGCTITFSPEQGYEWLWMTDMNSTQRISAMIEHRARPQTCRVRQLIETCLQDPCPLRTGT
jgi:hypothetical protein